MCVNCDENSTTIPSGNDGEDGSNGVFGGYSGEWEFSASTSSGPASTELRFNSSTYSAVTSIFISDTNIDSVNYDAFLDSIENNRNYGYIRVFKEFDSSIFWIGKVTSVTDNGTDHTIVVTYILHNGTFAATDSVVVSFVPSGESSKILFAYNDVTGIANDSAIGASVPVSYTIPANTLLNVGDELEVEVMYDYTNNDACNVGFKLGGSTILSYNVGSAFDITDIVNIKIAMISTTSQLWTMVRNSFDATNGTSLGLVFQTDSTASTTVSNLFEVVFTNSVFGANQLTLKKCVIKKDAI